MSSEDFCVSYVCVYRFANIQHILLLAWDNKIAFQLTVSASMHCAGGWCAWSQGCAWSGGVRVSAPGVLLQGGAWSGGVVSQHALRQTPPVNRILDTLDTRY